MNEHGKPGRSGNWFGLWAVLFVAGVLLLAWVVFTPGSQLAVSIVSPLMIAAGAQGIREGWK